MRALLQVVAGIVSVAAGIYLLQANSVPIPGVDSGTSWFELLAHGIGIYFIARGVWMFSEVGTHQEITERLDKIAGEDSTVLPRPVETITTEGQA